MTSQEALDVTRKYYMSHGVFDVFAGEYEEFTGEYKEFVGEYEEFPGEYEVFPGGNTGHQLLRYNWRSRSRVIKI